MPSVATPEPPEATGQSPAPQLFLCLLRVVTGSGGSSSPRDSTLGPHFLGQGPYPYPRGRGCNSHPFQLQIFPSFPTDRRQDGRWQRQRSESLRLTWGIARSPGEGRTLSCTLGVLPPPSLWLRVPGSSLNIPPMPPAEPWGLGYRPQVFPSRVEWEITCLQFSSLSCQVGIIMVMTLQGLVRMSSLKYLEQHLAHGKDFISVT